MESQKQVRVDEALTWQLSFEYPAVTDNLAIDQLINWLLLMKENKNMYGLKVIDHGVLLFGLTNLY